MNIFLCIILILIAILFLLCLITYFFLMDEPSVRVFYRTIGRDIRALYLYIKIFLFANYCRLRNLTIVDFFNKRVEKYPEKVCFVFEDEEWTYKKVDELSNKIAHCFLREGFRRGDEVALLMSNSPDYVCIWLGLAKIGVTTALIATSVKAESLAHSMNAIHLKGLIFGQNFTGDVDKAIPFIDKSNSFTFYSYTRKTEEKILLSFPCEHLNVLLDECPTLPLCQKKFKTNSQDTVLYIYTSGTTGLPKAVIVKHRRFLMIAGAGKYLTGLNESQIIYNTIPLYCLSGGIVFPSFILAFGGKMIIRKKFSFSSFWKDVVKYKATTCVYIGELCRYLLNAPKVPEETQHSVQLMTGNGLRPHIWKEFQERFRIKKIIEAYASSEGNANVVNYEGKTGAVGFISRIFFKIQGVYLVKINPETLEVMRDTEGLCIRCKPDEPGQIVANISNFNPMKVFDGYSNSEDSKRKIIKDCFRKGDKAFASGDILVMDEDGYLYFKDRCGDSFRWKAENVSTVQVENIFSKILNLASCIVYGVKIPGYGGRIGMAAIQVDDLQKVDFEKLHQGLSERLPTDAIPAFIRIASHIEETGTFKLRKVNFQKEGYNPEKISDLLYVLDSRKEAYVPLTTEIYADILSGRMEF